ncbi:MAG: MFS transporter [Fibrobacteres bacterium]|nr:MFS transporter [Fibrobacterota bacterium]
MYKKLGVSNEAIGQTSLLYLPWILKMFWAPLVDGRATKRFWIIITQALISLAIGGALLSLGTSWLFPLTLAAFVLAAFLSATHDVAADGFYMLALNKEQQNLYVGIRTLFYRLAMIFGSGALVYLAGKWESSAGSIAAGWMRVLGIVAAVYAVLSIYHAYVLPKPAEDKPLNLEGKSGSSVPLVTVFANYFKQSRVVVVILFIIFYRFGEALLLKMVAPFMLDTVANGGLELSTSQVGIVYGTIGLISLMLGGITGGVVLAKYGLKKSIWPFALIMNIPSLFFVYMAAVKPALPFVYALVAVEQFSYGLGMTALTVVLMASSKGEGKTSNFAISTGLMAIGMMAPGYISGWVQHSLGYTQFFTLAVLLCIPGMVLIPFLPKRIFSE